MYIYSLCGWEHNVVLQNEKKYTENEFELLCKQVPHSEHDYYEVSHLIKGLKKYGFKTIKYQAGLFTDGK